MATTLNASTSNGLIQTADTSGVLALQAADTTIASVSSTGVAVTGAITATGQIAAIKSETAKATTSGTSIDFTSIPSGVKRITVIFAGVSSSSTSPFLIRLGTSSGVVSTGYISTNASQAGTASSDTTGFLATQTSQAAADIVSGTMTIVNISSNSWVYSSVVKGSTASMRYGAGDVSLAATLDRIRLTTVNGTDTFDAGSINIFYE
jgi:hypothetical protein